MRGFIFTLFILIQLFSAYNVSAEEASPPVVYIDGQKIDFSVAPAIEDGTTLVQFRPIFEKLGLSIEWNGETQQIKGTKPGFKILLTIGSAKAYVNDKEIVLEKEPRIVDGNTVVPLRFVGEANGSKVDWDELTHRITIKSKDQSETKVATETKSMTKEQMEETLLNLEKRSASYHEAKDLDGFLSTIDESNPAYHSDWKGEFSQVTIHTELLSVKVIEYTNTTAKAETVKVYSHSVEIDPVKHITKEFRDKATSITKYVKVADGTWKIAGAEGTPQFEKLE